MVETTTQKVLIKRRPNSEDGNVRVIEIETRLKDYGESLIEDTNVYVSAAVAAFELKNEDRFQVIRLGDDKTFGKYHDSYGGL